MDYSKLLPLDTFNTYKPIPPGLRHLPERLVDYGIRKKGESRFPGGDTQCNHVRIYVGLIDGIPTAFEWTYPRARFIVVEDWMLDPSYCKLTRCVLQWDYLERVLDPYVKEHIVESGYDNSKYDSLQLLGIALGLKWLRWSKHRQVCSTGARLTQQFFFMTSLFDSEPWQTLPCAWLNSSKFHIINGAGVRVLKPEKKTHSVLEVGTTVKSGLDTQLKKKFFTVD